MKTPADIIIELMNETPEQTESRRAINEARRNSRPTTKREHEHKDKGLKESDFL